MKLWFVALLGLAGVLVILLGPLRRLGRFAPLRAFSASPAAGFSNKILASLLFCAAALAAVAGRAALSWPAACLLAAFPLALTGDLFLALEPLLARPAKDRAFVFVLGAVPFLAAHALNLAALAALVRPEPWLWACAAALPLACAVLWRAGLLRLKKNGAPLLLYAALLGLLLAAGVAHMRKGGPRGVLVLAAALGFVCSDAALFFFNFGRETPRRRAARAYPWLVMLPYYLAQTSMAMVLCLT